jgi:cytochrome P450
VTIRPTTLEGRIDDLIVAPSTYADPARYRELFAMLRRDEPVRWTEPEGYRPFWTISRHADVREVERQNELYVNGARHTLLSIADEQEARAFSGSTRPFRTIVSMDGLEHRMHRAILQKDLMPAAIRRLREDVAAVAREFVDRLLEQGGEADYVDVVASRYPLRVIMTLFGVPPEDEEILLGYAKMYASASDPSVNHGRPATQVRIEGAHGFRDYFSAMFADRRAAPRDDLASLIANATGPWRTTSCSPPPGTTAPASPPRAGCWPCWNIRTSWNSCARTGPGCPSRSRRSSGGSARSRTSCGRPRPTRSSAGSTSGRATPC